MGSANGLDDSLQLAARHRSVYSTTTYTVLKLPVRDIHWHAQYASANRCPDVRGYHTQRSKLVTGKSTYYMVVTACDLIPKEWAFWKQQYVIYDPDLAHSRQRLSCRLAHGYETFKV